MTVELRQPLQPAEPITVPSTASRIDRVDRGRYRTGGKRLLDVVLVLLALPVVVVILLPFVLLVALEGGNPFYRQARLGRDARVFGMWKLRSMVPDAERLLDSHLAAHPEARAEWQRDQKLRNDPRITRIGRFIRRTSIDELPQLWNVLMGDMSLVGPRPMMPEQRDLYPGIAYYAMRPGITGYWQTAVRNESSFAERALYDTAYFRDLSLGTDLRVLRDTVRVLAAPTGR
jgi:lipopolysaccharide/colanic/teichoic acid biosynthesis glycosyltransferase